VLGRWVTTDQRGALDESWSARSCAEAGVEEARQDIWKILVHLAV